MPKRSDEDIKRYNRLCGQMLKLLKEPEKNAKKIEELREHIKPLRDKLLK